MPKATHEPTTPTRRLALRFGATAALAGLVMPAVAKAASTDTSADADLIAACDRLVACSAEKWLLAEYDDWAPDFGPNNPRYEQLADEVDRLEELIEEFPAPAGEAGIAAIARATLVSWACDNDGDFVCKHVGEHLAVTLAETAAGSFVWPPRPGSCSTAHWAVPLSPAEVAKEQAARSARADAVAARLRAEREAGSEAYRADWLRRHHPSVLTDDDLRGQIEAFGSMTARAEKLRSELAAEMAKRGLA